MGLLNGVSVVQPHYIADFTRIYKDGQVNNTYLDGVKDDKKD